MAKPSLFLTCPTATTSLLVFLLLLLRRISPKHSSSYPPPLQEVLHDFITLEMQSKFSTEALHYWAPSNVSHLIFKSRSDSRPQLPYMLHQEPFLLFLKSIKLIILAHISLLGILFSWILTWLAPPQPPNLCSNATSLESHPMKMAPRSHSLTPILLPFPQSTYYYLHS